MRDRDQRDMVMPAHPAAPLEVIQPKRAPVEQAIAHLAGAWSLRRWRGLL